MKKLIISIFLILLLLIVFFQFQNFRRLNPPAQYEFAINKEIDVNYYDPIAVKEYFKSAYEIGVFARELWYNERIDVLYPDYSSEQSIDASKVFITMKSKATELEMKLLHSAHLKKQGFANNEIREMDIKGIGPDQYQLEKYYESVHLKIGDENQSVLQLQMMLNKRGYKIRQDGIFNLETKGAVQQFQRSKGLLPTGIADKRVLIELIKE